MGIALDIKSLEGLLASDEGLMASDNVFGNEIFSRVELFVPGRLLCIGFGLLLIRAPAEGHSSISKSLSTHAGARH